MISTAAEAIPCPVEYLQQVFFEKKLTHGKFDPEGVIHAAEHTGRKCSFVIKSDGNAHFCVSADAENITGLSVTLTQLARKAVSHSLVVERRPTRVLSDYGWTQDGKVFLTYKLSSGTLANGIVSVPAGMKQYLSGAHELRVAEGIPIGRLVIRDSQAWGLGPLFSRRGGDPGDSLRILFDLKTKIAVAELGQASVDEEDEVNQQMLRRPAR